MSTLSSSESIQTQQSAIKQALNHHLPDENTKPTRLHHAMRYVILNGGKRIRGLLTLATGDLFPSNCREALLTCACTVEYIHAYSLTHDDLPAMDDDDLRRGKPSCHKAYDEATAILVGDALHALAFELICNIESIQPEIKIRMIKTLADAIGSRGMVAGQIMDIANNNKTITLTELERMHRYKTGCLLTASIQLGALCANVYNGPVWDKLLNYANQLGLLYQIQDDLLDIEGETKTLGKPRGSDLKFSKATYPRIASVEQAKIKASTLYADAIMILDSLGERAKSLLNLTQFIYDRGF